MQPRIRNVIATVLSIGREIIVKESRIIVAVTPVKTTVFVDQC